MEALNSLVNVILVLLFALLVAEITKPFARFWSGDSKHESLREELKDWWENPDWSNPR